jgi:hypothetical protein
LRGGLLGGDLGDGGAGGGLVDDGLVRGEGRDECRARLFTARGRPRLVWWIRFAASSLDSWSLRPTSLRWWVR